MVYGRTTLHTCQGNVTGLSLHYGDNDILIQLTVVPYACRHGNAFIFQDDDARARSARVVQDHLQFRRIVTLKQPAKSPDLSTGEHLWDILRSVSGDALTSHGTSTSSLMHSRRNSVGSPKQPQGSSSGT